MPFLSGRVSAVQFEAAWPDQLTGQEVELLARFGAEPCVIGADGESCGWTAGQHQKDTQFAADKNIAGDFLVWDFRRTVDKLPGDRIKQYFAEAMAEFAAIYPSGLPTARQRREARESAREKVEDEARDGRYRKYKAFPVVWDRKGGRVWFGSSSTTIVDRFVALFQQTFGTDIRRLDPATIAGPEFIGPATEFIPGVTPSEYAWVSNSDHPLHLGNEFALWLMWRVNALNTDEVVPGTVAMVSRTLTLECPRGQTGRETVTHEGPVRLPEVRKALQAGKLPTKLGLIVVRHQEQYELTLAADQWVISAGKLPNPGDDAPTEPTERKICRLEAVRDMLDVVNHLYREFLKVRGDAGWEVEVTDIRGWLLSNKS